MHELSTPERIAEAHGRFKALARLVMDHASEPFYRAALDGGIDALFAQIYELQKRKEMP